MAKLQNTHEETIDVTLEALTQQILQETTKLLKVSQEATDLLNAIDTSLKNPTIQNFLKNLSDKGRIFDMFNKKILNKAYRNFYLKSRTYDMTRHMQDQVLENVTTELLDEKIDSIINNDSTKYSKDELSSIKKKLKNICWN